MSRNGVDLPRAATEGDCLRVVQARPGGELAGWFAGLTRAWLQTAYAHRPPPAADFERLATEWPRWFAGVAP